MIEKFDEIKSICNCVDKKTADKIKIQYTIISWEIKEQNLSCKENVENGRLLLYKFFFFSYQFNGFFFSITPNNIIKVFLTNFQKPTNLNYTKIFRH